MKTIHLPSLAQVTFEETSAFLLWLSKQPSGEIGLSSLRKNSPIRSSKLGPVLKILEQFGFLIQKQERASISPSGRYFLKLGSGEQRAFIKNSLLKIQWIQNLSDQLRGSGGRIHQSAIRDSFNACSHATIAESEINGLIPWAEACRLFIYDSKRQEIALLELVPPMTVASLAPERAPSL